MGYAVLNLSQKYIKRIPPGHFMTVRQQDVASFVELGAVAVEAPRLKPAGPQKIRGRYSYLLELVGALLELVGAPAEAPEAPAPVPAPEPTPDPAPEPTPDPAPEPVPEPTPEG